MKKNIDLNTTNTTSIEVDTTLQNPFTRPAEVFTFTHGVFSLGTVVKGYQARGVDNSYGGEHILLRDFINRVKHINPITLHETKKDYSFIKSSGITLKGRDILQKVTGSFKSSKGKDIPTYGPAGCVAEFEGVIPDNYRVVRPEDDISIADLQSMRNSKDKGVVAEYQWHKSRLEGISLGMYFGKDGKSHRDRKDYTANTRYTVTIDIDHVPLDDLARVMDLLKEQPCILSAFVSISGSGIKAECVVGDVTVEGHLSAIKDDTHYKQCFFYVRAWLLSLDPLLIMDESGKDVCRLCFTSYDPDALFREAAQALIVPPDFEFEETLDSTMKGKRSKKTRKRNPAVAGLESSFECTEANKKVLTVCTLNKFKDAASMSQGEWYKSLVAPLKHLTTTGWGWEEEDTYNLLDEISKQLPNYDTSKNRERWDNQEVWEDGGITFRSILEFLPKDTCIEVIRRNIKNPFTDDADKPNPELDEESGRYPAWSSNVLCALRKPSFTGEFIAYDNFRRVRTIQIDPTIPPREWHDTDNIRLRVQLGYLSFQAVGKESLEECAGLVAKDNEYDAAQEWLDTVPDWDGVKRVDTFNSQYFSTEDSPYTRAVARYFWTALISRILEPGSQCDMALVYVSTQGLSKTTGIKLLHPDESVYSSIDLSHPGAELGRKLQGCLIAELEELRGLNTKDQGVVKAGISARHDYFRDMYQNKVNPHPRRCIFVGTSNDKEFLSDVTGNRRWLPMTMLNDCNREGIIADRLQLWAEARHMFVNNGLQYKEAEDLATAEHPKYFVADLWEDSVAKWVFEIELQHKAKLAAQKLGKQYNTPITQLTTLNIAQFALGMMDKSFLDAKVKHRISSIMISLGYELKRQKANSSNPIEYYYYQKK